MKDLTHKLIVEGMQDGVFVACEGVIKYVNDSLLKMIGYNRKELINKEYLNFVHEDDSAFVYDKNKAIIEDNAPCEYEFRLRHKDGSTVYTIISAAVIELECKRAIAGTIKNITNRITTELKIKEVENSYKTLLELCPDPIIVSDFNGTILMHNQAAYDFNEPTSSKFKLDGRNVAESISTDEERERILKLASEDMSAITKYDIEFKTQKGRIVPFELHTTNVYDAQGLPTCKLTIGRDMSQTREHENQLKKLVSEKELMIKEIHHRIKNNLQQIYSLLGLQTENELLLNSYSDKMDGDENCFDMVNRIIADARRRILAISLVHEMFYVHNTDCIEFSLFIKELVKNIRDTYEMANRNVEVNVSGDKFELCLDYIIPCGLIANEIIINSYKYAFSNVENAVIDIKLQRKNGIRTIIISDNGSGMTIDDVAKTKTLGLSLVGGLTEQIDGTLSIESDVGKGTKYTIEFADRKTKSRGYYE